MPIDPAKSVWGTLHSRYGEKKTPRKILSLDGGGIRGVLTLEILLKIESDLKKELKGGDNFRLSDYFDYFGGTSTGAIIAAGLSVGMSVSQLLGFYEKKGDAMFDRASLFKKLKYSYDSEHLTEELIATFGDGNIDLESGKFKSLLLVVTMNRSTDSPWPITNNPLAKYNASNHPNCNLKIPLYKLVRASTAAPTYFPPESIKLGTEEAPRTFVFVDGGVTPYNNPAFLLYRMATQKAYNLNWETGEKKLLIVSVGTGAAANPGVYRNLIGTATTIPGHLMAAMQIDQDINCRTVGCCVYGASIDRELGDMVPLDKAGIPTGLSSDAGRHFTYIRYNADLSEEGLDKMGFTNINSRDIVEMDVVDNMPDLRAIGKHCGQTQVDVKSHFRHFLTK